MSFPLLPLYPSLFVQRRKLARAMIDAEDARAAAHASKDRLLNEQLSSAASARTHATAISAFEDRIRTAVRAAKEEAEYQWVQHEGISKEIGIDEEQIEAVRTGDFDSPALLPDAQALLRFTDQVLTRPVADEEVFEALRESFPPRQIVEVLLIIGNYRLLANFQTQLDLEIDPAVTPADYGHEEE